MKAPLLLQNPARSGVAAFSLVEVVLALGVVSFGMISIVGLLGMGLKNFHDAIDTTTEAQITQRLANELQLGSYANLTNAASTNYYFTPEGLETNAGSAIYTATIAPPVNLTVPGAGASYPTNTMAFSISIWSKSAPQTTNVNAVYISNNGL